jgi:hypothetical protein
MDDLHTTCIVQSRSHIFHLTGFDHSQRFCYDMQFFIFPRPGAFLNLRQFNTI